MHSFQWNPNVDCITHCGTSLIFVQKINFVTNMAKYEIRILTSKLRKKSSFDQVQLMEAKTNFAAVCSSTSHYVST